MTHMGRQEVCGGRTARERPSQLQLGSPLVAVAVILKAVHDGELTLCLRVVLEGELLLLGGPCAAGAPLRPGPAPPALRGVVLVPHQRGGILCDL